jgi:hypothetical protein
MIRYFFTQNGDVIIGDPPPAPVTADIRIMLTFSVALPAPDRDRLAAFIESYLALEAKVKKLEAQLASELVRSGDPKTGKPFEPEEEKVETP